MGDGRQVRQALSSAQSNHVVLRLCLLSVCVRLRGAWSSKPLPPLNCYFSDFCSAHGAA